MEKLPSWMTIVGNGVLGEARARSFLLERFWVLERSIDKDGADFLIQRRLSSSNFLSEKPPRLGVVQVKYVQGGKTHISLPASYVCDDKMAPFNEFFLLIFTGTEDSDRSFLLSASEILSTFSSKITDNERKVFTISAESIISSQTYEIVSKSRSLSKIESAIKSSDFYRNRNYPGFAPFIKIEKHHIADDYLIPLENHYGEIDQIFFENKKNLQKLLFDIEEVVDGIQEILREPDPLVALGIFEDTILPHISNGGRGENVIFSVGRFFDEDLLFVCEDHRRRLECLRKLNLQNNYLLLMDDFIKKVKSLFLTDPNVRKSSSCILKVRYSHDSLENLNMFIDPFPNREETMNYVIEKSCPGEIEIWINALKLWSANVHIGHGEQDYERNKFWGLSQAFRKEVERHLFGDDE